MVIVVMVMIIDIEGGYCGGLDDDGEIMSMVMMMMILYIDGHGMMMEVVMNKPASSTSHSRAFTCDSI